MWQKLKSHGTPFKYCNTLALRSENLNGVRKGLESFKQAGFVVDIIDNSFEPQCHWIDRPRAVNPVSSIHKI